MRQESASEARETQEPARLGSQSGDAGFIGDRAPKALAGPERGKLLRRRLASLRLPRGDQHARAGAEQRLGADPAKTGRSAGDQRRAASDGKKLAYGDHGSLH